MQPPAEVAVRVVTVHQRRLMARIEGTGEKALLPLAHAKRHCRSSDLRDAFRVGDVLAAVIIGTVEDHGTDVHIVTLDTEALSTQTRVLAHLTAGKIESCVVRSVFPSGAYVSLSGGLGGFIPAAELPPSIGSAEQSVYVGDFLYVSLTHGCDVHSADLLLSTSQVLARLDNENEETLGDVYPELFAKLAFEAVGVSYDPALTPLLPQCTLRSVLVCDDDSTACRDLSDFFVQRGYDCLATQSPRDVLPRLAVSLPDLIVLDCNLRTANGVDIARDIVRLYPEARVVLYSSPDAGLDTSSLLTVPLAGFMLRPLPHDELEEMVHTVEARTFYTNVPDMFLSRADPPERTPPHPSRDTIGGFTTVHKRLVADLCAQVMPSAVALLRMHPSSQEVSAVSLVNVQKEHFEAVRKDLPFSPIREVIHDNRCIRDGHAQARLTYYKHFLSLFGPLQIETVVGLSVPAQRPAEYGLFVAWERQSAATPGILQYLEGTCALLAAALREESLTAAAAVEQRFAVLGKLRVELVHDINLQMCACTAHVKSAQALCATMQTPAANEPRHDCVKAMKGALEQAARYADEVTNTLRTFRATSIDTCRIINAHDPIRRIYKLLGKDFLRQGLQLELVLCSDVPRVRVHPARFQQVLLNLCMNAAAHMSAEYTYFRHRKRLRIHTVVSQETDASAWVSIRVSDTGGGIHKKDFDRIFEPFVTTRRGSTGLGLFICRALLRECGGTICVERSHICAGTTFLVRLPLVESEGSANEHCDHSSRRR